MTRTTTMTVRLSGALSDFVSDNVGENGSFENVSEYVRHLIRADKARVEESHFARLKAELDHAFNAPEESYKTLSVDHIIKRNQR